jgi:hypothetical protein
MGPRMLRTNCIVGSNLSRVTARRIKVGANGRDDQAHSAMCAIGLGDKGFCLVYAIRALNMGA